MNIERLNIMLAEEDKNNHYFFDRALKELPITSHLTIVHDGEQLMSYLSENVKNLPDILFLDLNMSRKNGFECLCEIKADMALKDLPVVMFSTSFMQDRGYEDSMVEMLLKIGAYQFIHKSDDFGQLRQDVFQALTMVIENRLLPECKETYY